MTDKYYIMNKQEEAIIILIVLIIIKIKLLFSFFSFLDHFLEFPVVEFSVSVLIKLGHDSINLQLLGQLFWEIWLEGKRFNLKKITKVWKLRIIFFKIEKLKTKPCP